MRTPAKMVPLGRAPGARSIAVENAEVRIVFDYETDTHLHETAETTHFTQPVHLFGSGLCISNIFLIHP